MRRFLGIGALVLTLALLVPAAVLAFSAAQDSRSSGSASAQADDAAGTSDSEPKPWVGLYVMEVTEALAEKLGIDVQDGVAVVKVVSGGPADDAGIESGDVIGSIGGSDVATVSDVRDAVGAAAIGDTLAFRVERDGAESTHSVVVEERPTHAGGKARQHRGGKGHGLPGLDALRGIFSGDEEGPVSITLSAVTVTAVGEGSITLTPTADGNAAITATVTDGSFIVKDGVKADIGDVAVDDEGIAAIVDGELSALVIGSMDGFKHGRFGRFSGSNNGDDTGGFRRGGRGLGGGFTLPPDMLEGRDFLGPLRSLNGHQGQSSSNAIT